MAAGFFKSFLAKFTGSPVDWDELEELLIRADLGVTMTQRILQSLRARGWDITGETALEVTREEILKILPPSPPAPAPLAGKPNTSA